ncbi:aspartate aminotransferase family protein [Leuconostoc gasicomitatum]|uniref:aspartate aminotransferase family protein n=1 Tax=Leuconostoc gasicomitatum TaxID=115778 RepID=UPI001CC57A14|nr:aspartate aminotransferase family protein [Leuconostoc gasicomitatum]MBR2277535.1 aspartate aminotransferase family protein [Leuconostoc sp.]MBZ5953589.1 aspartate aminotransferase family protein [Leuconostoc gasicomitatum]MBZ5955102.1 aspartate aminotransferase family protein [Leuconostoc gasicomitatum]
MSKNQDILNEEKMHLADATRVKYFDIVIDHGQGAIITDANGRDYIDLLASASATNTGHSHSKIVAAITAQAKKLIQYTPAYFANTTTAALAKRLTELAPGNFDKQVAFGNSGSDANDAMIKFARGFTGRQYIVSFTGAYHGSTYGALSISGVSLNMARHIGPLLPGIVKVPFPDQTQRLLGESDDDFSERLFKQFKLPFETYLPADEVALVIIEPIQGDGGIIKAPQKYMSLVYEFTRENGIVFAVDEVNQGLGRTGKMWSIDHFGIAPDMMSIGKSIASGLPLSAVIGRTEIMSSLSAPANVYTTAGNPVTAAAALATLDVIAEEHLVARSEKLGLLAQEFFEQAAKRYTFIGDVRLYGLNGGIDIIDSSGMPDNVATTKLIYRIFELGAIMISLRGNTLRFQPPLVITEKQLTHAFNIMEQAFSELAHGQLTLPETDNHIGW